MKAGYVLVLVALMLWVSGGVWLIGYSGRVDLRNSLVTICKSRKVDSATTALSWRAQATADQIVADDKFQSNLTRNARRAGAAQHRKTATILERASLTDCQRTIPKPSLLF